jgi:methanogenic corrinoid protein MtbC1
MWSWRVVCLSSDLIKAVSKAIMLGDTQAPNAAQKCLQSGISIDEIVQNGVIKAWEEFCVWYERDPMESLKKWLDCYTATIKVLKLLDSSINLPEAPRASILVATVRGEGHVLMKEITSTLLRARGFKVYNYRKGVTYDDLSECFADPFLRFVVLSCVDEETTPIVRSLVESIRKNKPTLKIFAGGPMAALVDADAVVSDLHVLFERVEVNQQ